MRRATTVAELGLERGDLADDTPRLLVERLAVGGEMKGARRALQEAHAEPCFQAGDELADGRRREPEGWRGSRKALRLDHAYKGFHIAGAINHFCIIE